MADWDRSASPERPPPSSIYLQLGLGVLLTFVLHGIVGGTLGLVAMSMAGFGVGTPAANLPLVVFGLWAAGIGVMQLPYLLPAIAIGWVVRRPLGMGLLVGAGLTFLLNSACYGLVFVNVAILG